MFQWAICFNHKAKIMTHLMVGHFNWIEDMTVTAVLAGAKRDIQQALKPSQVPGGSKEDNIGRILHRILSGLVTFLCRCSIRLS